ncbi:MAG: hypothetical protein WBO46_13495 [Caldilineaceae bacterium]
MSADAKVFAGCCFIAVFLAGLVVGQDSKPPLCPVVQGQQIVSTVAPDTCIYVHNIYGRSVRKVKVKS